MAEIHHIPDDIPVRYLPRSKGATIGFALIFALGLVAFFVTLSHDPLQAWRDYLVNWLYFTSIATGAVIVAAAATVTKSKWNWSVRRVALAFAAFLPISFILFLPLLGAAGRILPWVNGMADDPVVNAKRAYLNLPFLFSRDILGLLALFGLCLYFAYLTLRPDLGLAEGAEGSDEPGRARWRERLIQGWMGQEREEVRCDRKMKKLAPGLAVVYAVVFSMIAYDWVMSLAPHWYSTLFGGWFFMGAFWGGAALTAVASVWVRTQHVDFARLIGPQQRHDLGKLSFAFCIFWGYLFWSQYLVIWYGKLPWEQAWIIQRSNATWGGLGVLTLILCFIVPFAGLIGRAPKIKPGTLATFTGVILIGLWLERYMMVVPSISPDVTAGTAPTISIWEPLIGFMFLGLFLAAFRWFLTTFPVVQVWQPLVDAELLEAEWNEVEDVSGRGMLAGEAGVDARNEGDVPQ